MRKYARSFAILIALFSATVAQASDGPGLLRGKFLYKEELSKNPLAAQCKPEGQRFVPPVAVDIAVALAGKVTESIIDAVVAKSQPEATTLEAVIPLDGFYNAYDEAAGGSDAAVQNGCLVFHNGSDDRGTGATLKAVWQVAVAPDNSAFRFDVVEWQFDRFLKPIPDRWNQKTDVRDFVLKIEFLSPGQDSLGTRSVFVEHSFIAVDAQAIAKAFTPGQELPWFSSPTQSRSSNAKDLNVPLNIRITVVETTKPNQFALWMQDIAKEKKADISTIVKDAVKRSLDPVFDATESAKKAETAGSAYGAYKTAWDSLSTQQATKPADLPANATAAAQSAYKASLNSWQASMTVGRQLVEARRLAAKAAFSAAGLPWAGDLPGL